MQVRLFGDRFFDIGRATNSPTLAWPLKRWQEAGGLKQSYRTRPDPIKSKTMKTKESGRDQKYKKKTLYFFTRFPIDHGRWLHFFDGFAWKYNQNDPPAHRDFLGKSRKRVVLSTIVNRNEKITPIGSTTKFRRPQWVFAAFPPSNCSVFCLFSS